MKFSFADVTMSSIFVVYPRMKNWKMLTATRKCINSDKLINDLNVSPIMCFLRCSFLIYAVGSLVKILLTNDLRSKMTRKLYDLQIALFLL